VFREHHLLKRTVRRIQRAVESKRAVARLELRADKHHLRWTTGHAFRRWRSELARKQHARAAAEAFRRFHVLEFAWTHWAYALTTRKVARNHADTADRFAVRSQARRSLHRLRATAAQRREVRALLPVATTALAKLRREACWNTWRQALRSRRVQQQNAKLADEIRRWRLSRRGMSVWRHSTAVVLSRRNATLLADAVHTHAVLGRAFRSFRVALVKRAWARDATDELRAWRDDLVLSRAMRVWRERTTSSWEERMRG
jgi:hypothetical protein